MQIREQIKWYFVAKLQFGGEANLAAKCSMCPFYKVQYHMNVWEVC